jgi:phosphoadenosine phosphosulfate reductase
MINTEIIPKTVERLKAFEPPEGYYGAFSGGKDSQVLYAMAEMAGVKVEWHFHRTSVDPPQLLAFIRQYYPEVTWNKPSKTIFQIIERKGILPTRRARFCCKELKETGGKGRTVIAGVRAQESVKRSTYDLVYVCKKQRKHVIYPLLDWTWNNVWNFLHDAGLPHCELYDPPYNYTRIGCVLCPMGGKKGMIKDARNFPKITRAYLNTIKKMMEQGRFERYETPEAVFKWWISGINADTFQESERQIMFCYD